MKSIFKKVAGIAVTAIFALGMAGCKPNVDTHEHTFATSYSSDETHHWNAATCEHKGEVKDKAEHTFGEWSLNSEGTNTRACDVCLFSETIIGTKAKSEAKTVGDIVFNDGSAIPYTAELTLTGTQKAAAIAVIFKAESDKVLGVGLKHDNGLVWCTEGAKAFDTDITTIKCPASGEAGELTFTGDTDGSDNLEQIATFLGGDNDTTGDGGENRYPAFYFAKNYKNVEGSNVKVTDYEDNWYFPTIAELFDVWKVKATVDAASGLCGGSKFNSNIYMVSSQGVEDKRLALTLNFDTGNWGQKFKDSTKYYVCCIRAFN